MNALPAALASKLNELCAAIATDSGLAAARDSAESFLADEGAVSLYREVMTLGRDLERQQQQGETNDESEMARFKGLQVEADANPLIRGFADAQEMLQGVLQTVNGFVGKTLESGAVPTHEDVFGSGGCGTGCGCH